MLVNGSTLASQTALEQLLGADDGAVGAQQRLEHAELLRRQRELRAAARGGPPRRVEPDVAVAQHRRPRRAGAPRERVHARDELGEAERLGRGSRRRPSARPSTSRRSTARRSASGSSSSGCSALSVAADVVAVDLGQVAVEHHDVVGMHARVEQRRAPRRARRRRRRRGGAGPSRSRRRRGLVLGEQDAHQSSSSWSWSWRRGSETWCSPHVGAGAAAAVATCVSTAATAPPSEQPNGRAAESTARVERRGSRRKPCRH